MDRRLVSHLVVVSLLCSLAAILPLLGGTGTVCHAAAPSTSTSSSTFDHTTRQDGLDIELVNGEALRYIAPGNATTYIFHIHNDGGTPVTVGVDLSMDPDPTSWTAELSVAQLHDILPGENDTVTLVVTAPQHNFSNNEVLTLDLIAMLVSDPNIYERFETVNIVDIQLDCAAYFALEPDPILGEKRVEITANETVSVLAFVANTGNVNMTYRVSLSAVPPDWTATFFDGGTNTTLNLSAPRYGEEESRSTLAITIHVPPDALWGARIDLHLTMETTGHDALGYGYMPGEDDDRLTIEVVDEHEFTISIHSPERSVLPGEEIDYHLTIRNNDTAAKNVTLHVASITAGWDYTLTNDTLALSPFEEREVRMGVTAPPDALAGARATVQLDVDDASSAEQLASRLLSAEVLPVGEMTANLVGADAIPEVTPNSNVRVEIAVNHTYNYFSVAALRVASADATWRTAFETDRELTQLALLPGENASVWFNLSVPSDAPLDADPATDDREPYRFTVNISTEEHTATVEVAVFIRQRYVVSIVTGGVIGGTPDSTAFSTLMLTNDGNGIDRVTVECADGADDDNTAIYALAATLGSLDATQERAVDATDAIDATGLDNATRLVLDPPASTLTLDMAPRQTLCLEVGIAVPAVVEEWTLVRDWIVTSGGDEPAGETDDNRATVWVQLRVPDLSIETITVEGGNAMLAPGDIVSIEVTVANTGNGSAADTTLAFSIDGAVIDTTIIPLLAPDSHQSYTFVWSAVAGEHTLRAQIDPSDRVTETHEDNNRLDRTLVVSGVDRDGDGVADGEDAFPDDPAASVDTDGDGYPDAWNEGYDASDATSALWRDAFPSDPAASRDGDGDGHPDVWNADKGAWDSTTGLRLDHHPDDPTRWDADDTGGAEDPLPVWFILIAIIVVVAVVLLVLVLLLRRRPKRPEATFEPIEGYFPPRRSEYRPPPPKGGF